MRTISYLTEEEKVTLNEGYKNSPKSHFRRKCHSILLSFEGYKVLEIANLYKVRTRTVYTWFNHWESNGISGLIMLKGRGIKAPLDQLSAQQLQQVKKTVKQHPQSLKVACEKLSKKFGFVVTKNMLKRVLKKTQIQLATAS
ncbi:MAG: transposase [Saprospiraceae bacterium]